jgi:hypothetical protein
MFFLPIWATCRRELSPISLAGIELMYMIKKGRMILVDGNTLSAAEQFYSLAA